jgi:2-C-methyl-D-erythritol 2,4-cyclodiphosphate synthase
MSDLRIGHGYDVHRLVAGRKLILGGVEIPHDKGLEGHSDADVLLHAISDALLGAASLGDIGQHFPPDDDAFKDADSADLLTKVVAKIRVAGFSEIVNVDAIIMAEQPKMAPHMPAMRQRIADILKVVLAQVGLKATTTERLGMVGREEGIAASAVCLIKCDE